MDGRTDGRTDGWMDGWMGKWVYGWMKSFINVLKDLALGYLELTINGDT